MRKVLSVLTVGLLVIVLGVSVAAAQDTLNLSGDPTFGGVDLSSGFLPDPYVVTVFSGGAIDASTQNIGAGCTGFVASNPGYRLNWTGQTANLRIFFTSPGDTTLIVNAPNGQYFCNDDGDGLNPILDFPNAAEGQYDIWIGSFASDEFLDGYLIVTEYSDSRPSAVVAPLLGLGGAPVNLPTQPPVPTAMSSSATGLDFSLEPTFGSVDLAPGFTPDPFEATLASGGPVDVFAQNIGADCTGYAAPGPDFRLNLSASSAALRIFFVGEEDTTLVINLPNGQWMCNDDSFGTLNPSVDIQNAPAGQYDIWIGSYQSGTYVDGTLYITELLDSVNPILAMPSG